MLTPSTPARIGDMTATAGNATAPYHHGDLPAALVAAARQLLDEDGDADLSLRAVARRAGVSTAAPYRHFADRESLVSSVAAVGFGELSAALLAVNAEPSTVDDLADLAVAYVRFALDKPGLFRVMFGETCDPTHPERAAAVATIRAFLMSVVERAVPGEDPDAAADATWAVVHGLAFLFLFGKFDASSPEAVALRVRAAVHAALASSS